MVFCLMIRRPPISTRTDTLFPYTSSSDLQGACLVPALLVLGLRLAIGDQAGAGLDVHRAVLHHRGAQRDAGIHRAAGAEVADAADVDATPVRLQLLRSEERRVGNECVQYV